MKKARNARKAILIVSDRGNNCSRLTPTQVWEEILESDLQLYAIGIFGDEADGRRTPEGQNGPGLLEEFAGGTGGRNYRVDRLDQLDKVAACVSNDLRNEYLLGYSSSNPDRDGSCRRVNVNLNAAGGQANMRTYYGRGCYAPVE